jgi:hypothetical protein
VSGAVLGAQDATPPVTFALDSNFRFLSVFLVGASVVLLWCLPRVERAKVPLRVVCAMVFLGGCTRLLSIAAVGSPDALFAAVIFADPKHRGDADHIAAPLLGDMSQGGEPRVGVVPGGGEPDVKAARVHGGTRKRHVVLPAEQFTNDTKRRVYHVHCGAVAGTPDCPLTAGRHQLAVPPGQLTVG